MTYKEFIDCVYEVVDCEGYIDRESEEMKTIEEVIGIEFKYFEIKEIYSLIQGMKILHEIQRESWRYFV